MIVELSINESLVTQLLSGKNSFLERHTPVVKIYSIFVSIPPVMPIYCRQESLLILPVVLLNSVTHRFCEAIDHVA